MALSIDSMDNRRTFRYTCRNCGSLLTDNDTRYDERHNVKYCIVCGSDQLEEKR
jgi:rRNA maturation endonuclease Nob1